MMGQRFGWKIFSDIANLLTDGAILYANENFLSALGYTLDEMLETAKAEVEVPSPHAGTVVALGGAPGDTLEVGALLTSIRQRLVRCFGGADFGLHQFGCFPHQPHLTADGMGHAPLSRMNPHAEVLKKDRRSLPLTFWRWSGLCRRVLNPEASAISIFDRQLARRPTIGLHVDRDPMSNSSLGYCVALEEADESALWLEILSEGGITKSTEALRLLDEANQLSAIFARSRITSIEGMKRRKESREGRDARVYLKRV
jgi:hypothetical protein